MAYRNVDGFVVIGADDRDPATSFENHRKRGSSGGVDVVAPFRTPVHAPDDCTIYLAPDNGTGGNTATLVFDDGWRDQMMHLDEFVLDNGRAPRNGQRLRQREQFALSGRSGEKGRYTYDPHVHWHRIGILRRDAYGPTSRYNPFDFFAETAGSGVQPITAPPRPRLEDVDMTTIIRTEQHGIYTVAPGRVIAHRDNRLTESIVAGYLPRKGVPAQAAVWDVAPEDLAWVLFDLAGLPIGHAIPAAGEVWRDDVAIAIADLSDEDFERIAAKVAALAPSPEDTAGSLLRALGLQRIPAGG